MVRGEKARKCSYTKFPELYNKGCAGESKISNSAVKISYSAVSEYDLFMKNSYKYNLTASQLVKDVKKLQSLLLEFPQYYYSYIIGPETAHLEPDYFKAFLADGGAELVRASSFHHYYMPCNDSVGRFLDVDLMNGFGAYLADGMNQSRSVNPQLPVWLSETGTCGRTTYITQRFASGFLMLDKLGASATAGVATVIRASIYGQNNSLIDWDPKPNPDYWLTLLYKRLVRGSVFTVSGRQDVRLYAACANTDMYAPGAVVIIYVNPNNYSLTFDLPQFQGQQLLLYVLTPGDSDGLVSK
nr:hypothetical protein BaRGS_022571 [Batillaria attramentaria]